MSLGTKQFAQNTVEKKISWNSTKKMSQRPSRWWYLGLAFSNVPFSVSFDYTVYSIFHLADSSCDWIHKLVKNRNNVLFMTPRRNNHSTAEGLWILRSPTSILAIKYWCYVWAMKQLIGGERCHFCNYISVAWLCVLVIKWCSCFEAVLVKPISSCCFYCAQGVSDRAETRVWKTSYRC